MRPQMIKINDAIRAPEVRVIHDELGSLGVMKIKDAIAKAMELGLDLVEISPDAVPPVAKIIDYGKFTYAQKKKQKDIKSKQNTASSEVKNIQIKVGTGENDIAIKAKRASEWLVDGHRVKVELYSAWTYQIEWDKNSSRNDSNVLLMKLAPNTKSSMDSKKVPKVSSLPWNEPLLKNN
jgi:translation initiation factor IF-3